MRKQLLDFHKGKKILEFEIGNIRSYSVENSFWNRLSICSKTDNVFNYAGKSALKRRKIQGNS